MQLLILELLPDRISGATYCTTSAVIAVATFIFMSVLRSRKRPNLDHIPTVGSTTWLGSWWAGLKYVFNVNGVIQEGYEKHKGGPFKISTFYDWMIVVSGRQCLDEYLKFREDELSIMKALDENLKADYTLGHDTLHNPYHISIVSVRLNRNLSDLYPEIRDEIVTSFDDILNLGGHEWKSVPASDAVLKIISRTSNRVFFGLPVCRDPNWIELSIRFTIEVAKGGGIINFFPEFMAPLVARFLTNVPGSVRQGLRHLSPIIQARRKHIAAGGSWDEMPNDLLSWMMQGPEGPRRDEHKLTERILALNFAAVHTTGNTFTQALFDLAAHPQYIPILREEVETIVREEGWSRASIAKMYKLDSFVKESQRISAIIFVNIMRKVVKDVRFSDGTFIPKGAFVAFATQPTHLDKEYYENPGVFDPFRFSRIRDEDDVNNTKQTFSTTTPEYLIFGHGKHACPGRFFATTMTMTMLAHVLLSYDVKLEDNATRPRNLVIGVTVSASPTARVMFRKRAL